MNAARDTSPVALITGAGSGIGAACASTLSRRGWRLALCGRRERPLRAVARDAEDLVLSGDIADEQRAIEMVQSTVTHFERLDGLVLNAGVATIGTVEETDMETWEAALRVNLTSPYVMARSALGALRATGGAIVTVGSIGALHAAPRSAAYAASKAGLVMLTQAMALDHGREGVRVNCVCPGWTRSEMSDELMAAVGHDLDVSLADAYALVTALVPQRRPAEPSEVAAAVAWLLSGEASYVNGATLVVDGGTSVVDAGTAFFTTWRSGE
jgi:meso-butanediol dehydrogenase / (S,S)-butanediol dehydrogenase / diacetyl reductase